MHPEDTHRNLRRVVPEDLVGLTREQREELLMQQDFFGFTPEEWEELPRALAEQDEVERALFAESGLVADDFTGDERHEFFQCARWRAHPSKTSCGYSLLEDKDVELPDHVCPVVAKQSVCRCHADGLLFYRGHNPYLVYPRGPAQMLGRVPDDWRVALWVRRRVPDGTVELYGLDAAAEDGDGRVFGPPRIIGTSTPGRLDTPRALADLEEKLRRWYADVVLHQSLVVRGRPKGSRMYKNRTEFLTDLLAALAAIRDRREKPTQLVVCDEMGPGMSRRQLQRYVRIFGIDWNSLK
jgi:hypothetical protein